MGTLDTWVTLGNLDTLGTRVLRDTLARFGCFGTRRPENRENRAECTQSSYLLFLLFFCMSMRI